MSDTVRLEYSEIKLGRLADQLGLEEALRAMELE